MKKKLVSLVLVAAMALGLAACGNKADAQKYQDAAASGDTEVGASVDASSDVEAAESAVTKTETTTLNIWMSSEPAHLDPALNSSVDGGCLAVNCFEGLMRYNNEGQLEPACAESYEVSEDGLTYTFTLRDGLVWSNGDALDATDFVYSWKRAAAPELAADYSYLCEAFEGFTYENGLAETDVVASEDGKTLTVKLAAVCPYFLDLCAFPFFFPVDEEVVEANPNWAADAGADFVSNGAFTLQDWSHDTSLTYVKNPTYWDADTVTIETLNVMLTSDDVTAYTAYQKGDLDFIDSIPTAEMQAAMANTAEFVCADSLGTYYAGFNVNSGIYAELGLDAEQAVTFRKAIALLIDRQYICDTIGQTGQVPATSFIPAGCADGNGGEFKNKDYFGTDYEANVAEAKSLLESIGLYDTASDTLTQTVSFTYLTNNSEGNVRIAEAIQSDLAAVGIDMKIDQQEWNVFLDTRKNGQFDFAREGWIMDYNDPINMLEMWTTESGNNDCQFGRDGHAGQWDEYNNLVAQIRTEADLAKRAEIMHQAEDMLMDTWCVIPIYYYNDPYMIKTYVKNVYVTVEGMKYFYHASIEL